MAKENKFQRKPLSEETRRLALTSQTGTRQGNLPTTTPAPAPEVAPTPAAEAAPAPAVAAAPAPAAATVTPSTAPAPVAPEPGPDSDELPAAAEPAAAPAAKRPRRNKRGAAAAPAAVSYNTPSYTVRLPTGYGPVLRVAGVQLELEAGDGNKVGVGDVVQMAVDQLLTKLRKRGLAIPEVKVDAPA